MSSFITDEAVQTIIASRQDGNEWQSGSRLKSRAQRLAGMLHKLHFPEEETELDLLRDVLEASPRPAAALLAIFEAALNTRGVPVQELLQPVVALLDSHLAQANTQQQLFTPGDLSLTLLAAIALLPEWQEDMPGPKVPISIAECIGHFMARGQLNFGLRKLADGVKEASCIVDEWSPLQPLVNSGEAAQMLLIAANCIKAHSGEGAAKAAWAAAGIDLASLMPSYGHSPEAEQKLLQQYDAQYLYA